MQNTKFKTLLESAQIKQADLSRRLGTSPTTESKLHKLGVPQYAAAYLELLAKYNRLIAKI